MPRQIFKRRVIATAGPLPGQLTPENIQKWTLLRKGLFSEDLTPDVTHLLCTREHFTSRVPRIKEALAMGNIHIVHYDWFEFSTVQEKRQPERDFSMRSVLAKHSAGERERARLERGQREAERGGVDPALFHIYHDREFFPYRIVITRDDQASGEPGQKYTLCLWESHARPHLYWFCAKFVKKAACQASYHRPSPCSRPWRAEMDRFMRFFRLKTGIAWEDRVSRQGTMTGPYFQYSPPTGGKPVGRRLRLCYDECLRVNAQLRGLPWPVEACCGAAEGGEAMNQGIRDAESTFEGNKGDELDDEGGGEDE